MSADKGELLLQKGTKETSSRLLYPSRTAPVRGAQGAAVEPERRSVAAELCEADMNRQAVDLGADRPQVTVYRLPSQLRLMTSKGGGCGRQAQPQQPNLERSAENLRSVLVYTSLEYGRGQNSDHHSDRKDD